MAKQITKDTIIGDLLKINADTAEILYGIGMHCVGCPASRGETIEQACLVHNVDPDELVDQINEFLESAS